MNITEEYIKVNTQDGLVYFDQFRIADVVIIPISENLFRMEIDIKSCDGPYSKEEKLSIEKSLGKPISESINYAWLSMKNANIEINSKADLQDLELLFENGYDENTDRYLGIYFGWGIQLNNNKLKFEKIENSLYLNWTATSGDIDYYDERAKDAIHEFRFKVNIVELNHLDEINKRWKFLANKTKRYYEIMHCMKGFTLQGEYSSIHAPINEEFGIKHSNEAWKKTSNIMQKFPKPDHY